MAKRVYFNDVTLRDGHQSCAATRMTTEQCMRVLPIIKDAGYNIFELWGGATLDSAIRFTRDDPWERLEKFRDCMGGGEKIELVSQIQQLRAGAGDGEDKTLDITRGIFIGDNVVTISCDMIQINDYSTGELLGNLTF